MYHTTLRIDGMACGHCLMKVQGALEQLGAANIRIDLASGETSFDSIENPGIANIVSSITHISYRPHDLLIQKVDQ